MPGQLNPLLLAASLPHPTTAGHAGRIYNHLAQVTPGHGQWLPIRQLALSALALATTASPPTNQSLHYKPTFLWTVIVQMIHQYIMEDTQSLERRIQAEGLIAATLSWCDGVVQTRGEDRSQWFSGQEWLALTNLWFTLGKRVSSRRPHMEALANLISLEKEMK